MYRVYDAYNATIICAHSIKTINLTNNINICIRARHYQQPRKKITVLKKETLGDQKRPKETKRDQKKKK